MKRNCYAKMALSWFFLSIPIYAEQCPALLNEPIQTKTFGEVRVKAINGWDKLITWVLSSRNTPYHVKHPLEQKVIYLASPSLPIFDQNYGYYSIYHPIYGIVTDEKRDWEVVNCILSQIHEEIQDPVQKQFATEEILTKVMAYRELKKGVVISFSVGESLESYVVDEVIDLWHGMPAFGLLPQNRSAPPVLLYRGTDINLNSEKSWASLLSDLDTSGPGYATYLGAREKIRAWLKKAKDDFEEARVMGFSLGGAFTLYTLLHERDLVSQKWPSVVFNAPGIGKKVLSEWESLPLAQKPPHVTYIVQGDLISHIGFFFSNVMECSLLYPLQVIAAHATLICAQPVYKITAVDVPLENKAR